MSDPRQQAVAQEAEGGMARADLYRAAKHAMKLFQLIQDGQQLEGWVQAKITKSADYLDSIYHYMEYQVKFGGGAQAASVQDITSEADQVIQPSESEEVAMDESMTYDERLRALLESKINKKVAEGMKVGDTRRSASGGTITKTATGVKHTRDSKSYSDEPHTEPKSTAKSRSAAEKSSDKSADKAQAKNSKDYSKKHPGTVKTYKDGKLVKEGSKPDFLDMDKDGNKKETMKKAVADKKKTVAKKVDEAKKEKEPEGTYSSKRHETDGQRIARLAKEKRQAQNKERMKNDYNAEMER